MECVQSVSFGVVPVCLGRSGLPRPFMLSCFYGCVFSVDSCFIVLFV